MYSRKYIDIITLVVVTIILLLINLYQFQTKSNIEKVLNQTQTIAEMDIIQDEPIENEIKNSLLENVIKNEIIEKSEDFEPVPVPYPSNWSILIPKIDLIAPVREGTTDEILNKYVGHFTESPTENGNICLAAHNRGYEENYFENLKKLLLNDVIIYRYDNLERKYAVSNITIIKETDWSYIESSNDNILTLITCIEDEPEYRLCVQAKEIK